MSQNCIDLIKHFEGFSPVIYTCPANYLTIGYGHLVHKGEDYPGIIGEAEATELLTHDVATARAAVLRLITAKLSQGELDALTSFTFNLGAGALQRSTLRAKINRDERGDAPAEFSKWIFAGGRKLPGLIKRRQAEAFLYETGYNMWANPTTVIDPVDPAV